MKCVRTTLTLVVIAVLGTAVATATDYTFNGNVDNTWDDAGNWAPPGGPPQAGDTATIPSAETCLVTDADQEADSVDVQGTLGVVGARKLTLGKNNNATHSTVDGTLYFDETVAGTPELHIRARVYFDDSTGTITARADDGYGGVIKMASDSQGTQRDVLFETGLTVVGSLDILIDFWVGGTVKVDDADDTMNIGPETGSATGVLKHPDQNGKFLVTAGTLRFRTCALKEPHPAWTVRAGTILVTNKLTDPVMDGTVTVSDSGTLQCDGPLVGDGGLYFSGGTIKVKQGTALLFRS